MKPIGYRILFTVSFFLLSFICCTAEEPGAGFPGGCKPAGFSFKGDNLVLKTGAGEEQDLYLLHNISGKPLMLNHPVRNPGASAGWASEIGPGNWSAIAMNIREFELSCAYSGAGEYESAPCAKALEACGFANAVFPSDLTGSFWVSEDQKQDALLGEIKSRGISWQ